VKGRDREEVFVRCLEGVFDAIHIPDLQVQAEKYVRELSRHLFTAEIRSGPTKDAASRRYPGPMLSCYLEAFPTALARENVQERSKSHEFVSSLVRDLVTMVNYPDVAYQDIVPTLHHIASRFSSLCLETGWVRKSAGCSGIKIMTCTPDLGVKWINDREVDLVRTLLHVLKDMPYDLPRDVDDVVDVLIRVLRVSNADLSSARGAVSSARNKLVHLTGIFFGELASPNPIVRQTAQRCIQLLSELSEKTVVDLLLPLRDKVLSNLYTKPLRALPFSIQIGIIEAVRYCVSLEPPLPELNDELLRLLHEVLALGDADDAALIGRGNPRQSLIEINKLRVACIKLLTASMSLTDFFSKQIQTRQKCVQIFETKRSKIEYQFQGFYGLL
jgi:transformation/transcription domain-associated protein